MQSIRIFLSSSSDVAAERRELEVLIARENRALTQKGLFLELVTWEDNVESMSRARLQDQFNEAIAHSDIFVTVLHTRVGKYFLEEFEQALDAFSRNGKPLLLTYFKDLSADIATTDMEGLASLIAFRQRLHALGHFATSFQDVESLKQHFIAQLAKALPVLSTPTAEAPQSPVGAKSNVFISYSHRDTEYLERLLVHLAPLVREGVIRLWDDTKLQPGDNWQAEIERNLSTCGVAVLLVSADFLASEFITGNELPPLLEAASVKGTRITPIVVKPCRFSRDKRLRIYQSVNPPDRPLSGESEHERERIYDKLAEVIEAFTLPSA